MEPIYGEYFEWLVSHNICFVKYCATAFSMQQELLMDMGRQVGKSKITEDNYDTLWSSYLV